MTFDKELKQAFMDLKAEDLRWSDIEDLRRTSTNRLEVRVSASGELIVEHEDVRVTEEIPIGSLESYVEYWSITGLPETNEQLAQEAQGLFEVYGPAIVGTVQTYIEEMD